MDFFALNYSLATLGFVAIVSFFLGRWSKNDGPARARKPIGQAPRPDAYKPHPAKRLRDLSPNAEREIEHLLARGKMIAAIKVARRELGIGLKDAKHVIDDMRRDR